MRINNSRMKVERVKLGITQRQLGLELGVSDVYISHIEIGRRKAGNIMEIKLESYFNMKMEDLLAEVVL